MAVMKALTIDGTTYETVGSASVTQTVSSGTKIGSVTIDGTTTDLYAPNGGSDVSVTQTLASGTEIGSITVDDTTTTLYAPTATSVSVTQTLSSGEEIGSITVGSTTTTLYAPSGGGSVNILTLYTNYNCTALWADSALTTSVLAAYDYDYSAVYNAFDNADIIKVIGSGNKRHYVVYFNYKSADDDFTVAIADNTTLKEIYIT